MSPTNSKVLDISNKSSCILSTALFSLHCWLRVKRYYCHEEALLCRTATTTATSATAAATVTSAAMKQKFRLGQLPKFVRDKRIWQKKCFLRFHSVKYKFG